MSIGAAPDSASFMRPPKRSRILCRTSLSAAAYFALSTRPGWPPRSSRSRTSRPTPTAQWKIFAFAPPAASAFAVAAVWIFSKMRGTDGRCVGLMSCTSSTIFFGSRRQYAISAPASTATSCTIRVSTWASGRKT